MFWLIKLDMNWKYFLNNTNMVECNTVDKQIYMVNVSFHTMVYPTLQP